MKGTAGGSGKRERLLRQRRFVAFVLTFAMVAELIPAQALRAMAYADPAEAEQTVVEPASEATAEQQQSEQAAPAQEATVEQTEQTATTPVEEPDVEDEEASEEEEAVLGSLAIQSVGESEQSADVSALDVQTGTVADDGAIEVGNLTDLNAELAKAGDATIRLTADIPYTSGTNPKLTSSGTKTLDLNGHTLVVSDAFEIGVRPSSLNAVDVTDTSRTTALVLKGDGTIKANTTGGARSVVRVCAGASFTMEGGTIDATDASENGVFVYGKGASATINGGTIKASSFALTGHGNASVGTKLTVNEGATLESTTDYVIYGPDKTGVITINGGTLTGAAGVVSTNASDVVVKGGTLTSTGTGDTGTGTDGTTGQGLAVINVVSAYDATSLTVTGGTFDAQGSSAVIAALKNNQNVVVSPVTVEISGGTFNKNPLDALSSIGPSTSGGSESNLTVEGDYAPTYDETTGKYTMTDNITVTATPTRLVAGSADLQKKLTVSVQLGSSEDPLDAKYYDLTYTNSAGTVVTSINAVGKYTITAKGKDIYANMSGSATIEVVNPIYTTEQVTAITVANTPYTGEAITPEVTFYGNDNDNPELTIDETANPYTLTIKDQSGSEVSAENLKNAGTYTCTVTFTKTNNKVGPATFKITPIDLTKATLTFGGNNDDFTGSGSSYTYGPTVAWSGSSSNFSASIDTQLATSLTATSGDVSFTLAKGTDYTLGGGDTANSTEVKSSTDARKDDCVATITGTGNFTGTVNVAWTAGPPVAQNSDGSKSYTTLQAAIEDAEKTATSQVEVKLTANTQEHIDVKGNVKIDTAGYVLTGPASDEPAITVVSTGTLELTASNAANPIYSVVSETTNAIVNNGTLNITNSTAGGGVWAKSGTGIVNYGDATISASNWWILGTTAAIDNAGAGTLTTSAGSYRLLGAAGSVITSTGAGTTTVSGGNYGLSGANATGSLLAISKGTVNLTGMTNTGDAPTAASLAVTGGVLNIGNALTFNATSKLASTAAPVITNTGGTVNVNAALTLTPAGGQSAIVNGNEVAAVMRPNALNAKTFDGIGLMALDDSDDDATPTITTGTDGMVTVTPVAGTTAIVNASDGEVAATVKMASNADVATTVIDNYGTFKLAGDSYLRSANVPAVINETTGTFTVDATSSYTISGNSDSAADGIAKAAVTNSGTFTLLNGVIYSRAAATSTSAIQNNAGGILNLKGGTVQHNGTTANSIVAKLILNDGIVNVAATTDEESGDVAATPTLVNSQASTASPTPYLFAAIGGEGADPKINISAGSFTGTLTDTSSDTTPVNIALALDEGGAPSPASGPNNGGLYTVAPSVKAPYVYATPGYGPVAQTSGTTYADKYILAKSMATARVVYTDEAAATNDALTLVYGNAFAPTIGEDGDVYLDGIENGMYVLTTLARPTTRNEDGTWTDVHIAYGDSSVKEISTSTTGLTAGSSYFVYFQGTGDPYSTGDLVPVHINVVPAEAVYNGTYYATVEEAIAAANADEDQTTAKQIQLLKSGDAHTGDIVLDGKDADGNAYTDATVGTTTLARPNTTLHLNGVTATVKEGGQLTFAAKGTLATDGAGALVGGGVTPLIVAENGDLSFSATSTSLTISSDADAAIEVREGGKLTAGDSKVTVTSTTAEAIDNAGTATISAGKFNGVNQVVVNSGTASIAGATLSLTSVDDDAENAALIYNTGATTTEEIEDAEGNTNEVEVPGLTLKDGKYMIGAGGVTASALVNAEDASASVEGTNYSNLYLFSTTAASVVNAGDLAVSGGLIGTWNTSYPAISNSGTLTVDDGSASVDTGTKILICNTQVANADTPTGVIEMYDGSEIFVYDGSISSRLGDVDGANKGIVFYAKDDAATTINIYAGTFGGKVVKEVAADDEDGEATPITNNAVVNFHAGELVSEDDTARWDGANTIFLDGSNEPTYDDDNYSYVAPYMPVVNNESSPTKWTLQLSLASKDLSFSIADRRYTGDPVFVGAKDAEKLADAKSSTTVKLDGVVLTEDNDTFGVLSNFRIQNGQGRQYLSDDDETTPAGTDDNGSYKTATLTTAKDVANYSFGVLPVQSGATFVGANRADFAITEAHVTWKIGEDGPTTSEATIADAITNAKAALLEKLATAQEADADAALASVADAVTIALINDTTETVASEIAAADFPKGVTLDLGGHKATFSGEDAQLTVAGEVALKGANNSVITSADATPIVVADGGVLTSAQDAGALTISTTAANAAAITVEEGGTLTQQNRDLTVIGTKYAIDNAGTTKLERGSYQITGTGAVINNTATATATATVDGEEVTTPSAALDLNGGGFTFGEDASGSVLTNSGYAKISYVGFGESASPFTGKGVATIVNTGTLDFTGEKTGSYTANFPSITASEGQSVIETSGSDAAINFKYANTKIQGVDSAPAIAVTGGEVNFTGTASVTGGKDSSALYNNGGTVNLNAAATITSGAASADGDTDAIYNANGTVNVAAAATLAAGSGAHALHNAGTVNITATPSITPTANSTAALILNEDGGSIATDKGAMIKVNASTTSAAVIENSGTIEAAVNIDGSNTAETSAAIVNKAGSLTLSSAYKNTAEDATTEYVAVTGSTGVTGNANSAIEITGGVVTLDGFNVYNKSGATAPTISVAEDGALVVQETRVTSDAENASPVATTVRGQSGQTNVGVIANDGTVTTYGGTIGTSSVSVPAIMPLTSTSAPTINIYDGTFNGLALSKSGASDVTFYVVEGEPDEDGNVTWAYKGGLYVQRPVTGTDATGTYDYEGSAKGYTASQDAKGGYFYLTKSLEPLTAYAADDSDTITKVWGNGTKVQDYKAATDAAPAVEADYYVTDETGDGKLDPKYYAVGSYYAAVKNADGKYVESGSAINSGGTDALAAGMYIVHIDGKADSIYANTHTTILLEVQNAVAAVTDKASPSATSDYTWYHTIEDAFVRANDESIFEGDPTVYLLVANANRGRTANDYVDVSDKIEITRSGLTFNLNGQTLNLASGNSIDVAEGVENVTIVNNHSSNAASITGANDTAGALIDNAGELTLSAGTKGLSVISTSEDAPAVANTGTYKEISNATGTLAVTGVTTALDNAGIATIASGTYKITGTDGAIIVNSGAGVVATEEDAEDTPGLTITGGTFSFQEANANATPAVAAATGSVLSNTGWAVVNITGNGAQALTGSGAPTIVNERGTLDIAAGTVSADNIAAAPQSPIVNDGGIVNVNGGAVGTATATDAIAGPAIVNNGGTLNVKDGVIRVAEEKTVVVNSGEGAEVNVTGGSIISTNKTGVVFGYDDTTTDATINLYAGKFSGKLTADETGDATVNINVVTKTNENGEETVVYDGGTYEYMPKGASANDKPYWDGPTYVEGSTYNYTEGYKPILTGDDNGEYQIKKSLASYDLVFTGPSLVYTAANQVTNAFNGSTYYYKSDEEQTKYPVSAIAKVVPSTSGAKPHLLYTDADLTVSEATETATAVAANDFETTFGYGLQIQPIDDNEFTSGGNTYVYFTIGTGVASVTSTSGGTVGYATLAEAIEAANKVTSNAATIKLLTDVDTAEELGSDLEAISHQAVTLDLNGFNLDLLDEQLVFADTAEGTTGAKIINGSTGRDATITTAQPILNNGMLTVGRANTSTTTPTTALTSRALTIDSSGTSAISNAANATLTVTADSVTTSAKDTATITAEAGTGVANSGTLKVETANVTISGATYGIDNTGEATLDVDGGSIAGGSAAIHNSDTATATVDAATLTLTGEGSVVYNESTGVHTSVPDPTTGQAVVTNTAGLTIGTGVKVAYGTEQSYGVNTAFGPAITNAGDMAITSAIVMATQGSTTLTSQGSNSFDGSTVTETGAPVIVNDGEDATLTVSATLIITGTVGEPAIKNTEGATITFAQSGTTAIGHKITAGTGAAAIDNAGSIVIAGENTTGTNNAAVTVTATGNGATVVNNTGTIETTGNGTNYSKAGLAIQGGATAAAVTALQNDGTFAGSLTVTNVTGATAVTNSDTMTITAGSINLTANDASAIVNDGDLTLGIGSTAYTILNNSASYATIVNNDTLTVAYGTVQNNGNGYAIDNEGTLEATGGTIRLANAVNSDSTIVKNAGTVSTATGVNGTTPTSPTFGYAITSGSGKVTIFDSTESTEETKLHLTAGTFEGTLTAKDDTDSVTLELTDTTTAGSATNGGLYKVEPTGYTYLPEDYKPVLNTAKTYYILAKEFEDFDDITVKKVYGDDAYVYVDTYDNDGEIDTYGDFRITGMRAGEAYDYILEAGTTTGTLKYTKTHDGTGAKLDAPVVVDNVSRGAEIAAGTYTINVIGQNDYAGSVASITLVVQPSVAKTSITVNGVTTAKHHTTLEDAISTIEGADKDATAFQITMKRYTTDNPHADVTVGKQLVISRDHVTVDLNSALASDNTATAITFTDEGQLLFSGTDAKLVNGYTTATGIVSTSTTTAPIAVGEGGSLTLDSTNTMTITSAGVAIENSGTLTIDSTNTTIKAATIVLDNTAAATKAKIANGTLELTGAGTVIRNAATGTDVVYNYSEITGEIEGVTTAAAPGLEIAGGTYKVPDGTSESNWNATTRVNYGTVLNNLAGGTVGITATVAMPDNTNGGPKPSDSAIVNEGDITVGAALAAAGFGEYPAIVNGLENHDAMIAFTANGSTISGSYFDKLGTSSPAISNDGVIRVATSATVTANTLKLSGANDASYESAVLINGENGVVEGVALDTYGRISSTSATPKIIISNNKQAPAITNAGEITANVTIGTGATGYNTVENTGAFTLLGGTLTAPANASAVRNSGEDATFEAQAGTIYGNSNAAIIANVDDATLNVAGATIAQNGSSAPAIENSGTLNATGGTIRLNGAGTIVANTGTVNTAAGNDAAGNATTPTFGLTSSTAKASTIVFGAGDEAGTVNIEAGLFEGILTAADDEATAVTFTVNTDEATGVANGGRYAIAPSTHEVRALNVYDPDYYGPALEASNSTYYILRPDLSLVHLDAITKVYGNNPDPVVETYEDGSVKTAGDFTIDGLKANTDYELHKESNAVAFYTYNNATGAYAQYTRVDTNLVATSNDLYYVRIDGKGDYDGTYTYLPVKVVPAEARINAVTSSVNGFDFGYLDADKQNTYYASLADAVKAVNDVKGDITGAQIHLVARSANNSEDVITLAEPLTIEAPGVSLLLQGVTADLTDKSGTIVKEGVSLYVTGEGKITFAAEGGKLAGNSTAGTANLLYSDVAAPIEVASTGTLELATMNSGTVTVLTTAGDAIANAGVLTANNANGTYTSTTGAAIANTGTFTANNGTFAGATAALSNTGKGVATLNGGTFRLDGAGAIVYNESGPADTTETNTTTGVKTLVHTPGVTIVDGTYTYDKTTQSYGTLVAAGPVVENIKGGDVDIKANGTFTSQGGPVIKNAGTIHILSTTGSNYYAAAGYSVVENDGTIEVGRKADADLNVSAVTGRVGFHGASGITTVVNNEGATLNLVDSYSIIESAGNASAIENASGATVLINDGYTESVKGSDSKPAIVNDGIVTMDKGHVVMLAAATAEAIQNNGTLVITGASYVQSASTTAPAIVNTTDAKLTIAATINTAAGANVKSAASGVAAIVNDGTVSVYDGWIKPSASTDPVFAAGDDASATPAINIYDGVFSGFVQYKYTGENTTVKNCAGTTYTDEDGETQTWLGGVFSQKPSFSKGDDAVDTYEYEPGYGPKKGSAAGDAGSWVYRNANAWYIGKSLEALEVITNGHEGIEKVYGNPSTIYTDVVVNGAVVEDGEHDFYLMDADGTIIDSKTDATGATNKNYQVAGTYEYYDEDMETWRDAGSKWVAEFKNASPSRFALASGPLYRVLVEGIGAYADSTTYVEFKVEPAAATVFETGTTPAVTGVYYGTLPQSVKYANGLGDDEATANDAYTLRLLKADVNNNPGEITISDEKPIDAITKKKLTFDADDAALKITRDKGLTFAAEGGALKGTITVEDATDAIYVTGEDATLETTGGLAVTSNTGNVLRVDDGATAILRSSSAITVSATGEELAGDLAGQYVVTVDGGTLELRKATISAEASDNEDPEDGLYGINALGESKVLMTTGTPVITTQRSALVTDADADVTITINVEDAALTSAIGPAIAKADAGTLTIANGTVEGGLELTGGDTTISGGAVKVTNQKPDAAFRDAVSISNASAPVSLTVTGGSIGTNNMNGAGIAIRDDASTKNELAVTFPATDAEENALTANSFVYTESRGYDAIQIMEGGANVSALIAKRSTNATDAYFSSRVAESEGIGTALGDGIVATETYALEQTTVAAAANAPKKADGTSSHTWYKLQLSLGSYEAEQTEIPEYDPNGLLASTFFDDIELRSKNNNGGVATGVYEIKAIGGTPVTKSDDDGYFYYTDDYGRTKVYPTDEVGTYVLTIGPTADAVAGRAPAAGRYAATTITCDFVVKGRDLDSDKTDISIEPTAGTYTGSQVVPEQVVVTYDGETLTENVDYTLGYGDNVDAGTGAGTVVVTAVDGGHYSGETSRTFDIDPAQLTSENVVVDGQTYTGAALQPKPIVTFAGSTLVEGTDYAIVGYMDNTNVGEGTVTIKGLGNFAAPENVSATFDISAGTVSVPTPVGGTYDGSLHVIAAASSNGVYALAIAEDGVNTSDAVVVAGSVVARDAGLVTVKASLTDPANYTWADGTTEDKTLYASIAPATVDVPEALDGLVYDGTPQSGVADDDLYVVTSEPSVDAGTHTATVALADPANYVWADGTTDAKDVEFEIARAALAEDAAPSAEDDVTYDDGEPQTVVAAGDGYELSVKDAGTTGATLDDDGNVVASNAGTGTALVTPDANHTWADGTTDAKEVPFSVAKAAIDAPDAASDAAYTNDEAPKTVVAAGDGYALSVKDAGATEAALDESGNVVATKAGSGTALATPDANHTWSDGTTGAKEVPFSVAKASVELPEGKTLTYNRAEQTGVEAGAGYVLSGKVAAKDAGSYTATATLDANHQWADGGTDAAEIDWTIERASLETPVAAVVAPIADQAYTGSAVTPTGLVVTLDGYLLAEGTDYTLGYKDNVNVGDKTAQVIVRGAGNYAGSVTASFSIVASVATLPADLTETYDGAIHAIEGNPTVAMTTIAATNAGTYTAKAKPAAGYVFADDVVVDADGAATVTLTIVPASLASATISGVSANYAFTGSAIKPTPTVTLAGKTLAAGTDYDVSYGANTAQGSTGTVTVTGKGNYTESAGKTFAISTVSKAALNSAISSANTDLAGTKSSSNGSDVAANNRWTTPAARNTAQAAITAAQGVANNANATQAQVDAAAKAVSDAKASFDNAKRAGTYRPTFSTLSAHIQTYGWRDAGWNGYYYQGLPALGTTGQSKRVEGMRIGIAANSVVSGGLTMNSHVQTYGDQKATTTAVGQVGFVGTTGQSKRMEAIWMSLTGEISQGYSVWYRAHIQTVGWLGWAKDGARAGSAGLSRRMEAIEVVILPKGETPVGYNANVSAYRTSL